MRIGVGSHVDLGLVTVAPCGSRSGLELRPNGRREYVAVEPQMGRDEGVVFFGSTLTWLSGGAVVRVGELRGGGSEEPAPPGDGSLGKAFYDTNPDFGAALADQLFDASMRGVRVERGDTVESSITTAFGTFAGTTGRLGAARVLVEAATAVAPKARPAEGVSVAAVKAKQPPSEAEWGGLLRALSA